MLKIRAPCKINLHLQIGDRHADGYHDLKSIFAALDFGDTLGFELLEDGAGGFCDILTEGNTEFPVPLEKNIIYKAVSLYRSRTGFDRGLRIRLEKRIPLGGGLGGGSSDAASALMALNTLAGDKLSPPELTALAEQLGSDVPFFLGACCTCGFFALDSLRGVHTQEPAPRGSLGALKKGMYPESNHLMRTTYPAACDGVVDAAKNPRLLGSLGGLAWVSGRGEHIEPLPVPSDLAIVLVNPGFFSGTAEAFRHLDQWREQAKTAPIIWDSLKTYATSSILRSKTPMAPGAISDKALKRSLGGHPQDWPYKNDFLPVFLAGKDAKAYGDILSRLKALGADFAGLSGAGSTCFGVFADGGIAEKAAKILSNEWKFVKLTFFLAYSAIRVLE